MIGSYGVWAVFDTAERAVSAAAKLRGAGVALLDAHTPFGIPELESLVGVRRPMRIPWLVLAGAVTGGLLAFLIIYWTAAVDYPLNVGGRPLNSLPLDIPIVFETTILFSASTAFVCALGFSGMPRLNHPLEGIPAFTRTSVDRYWLLVAAGNDDARADVERLLREAGALDIHDASATWSRK